MDLKIIVPKDNQFLQEELPKLLAQKLIYLLQKNSSNDNKTYKK